MSCMTFHNICSWHSNVFSVEDSNLYIILNQTALINTNEIKLLSTLLNYYYKLFNKIIFFKLHIEIGIQTELVVAMNKGICVHIPVFRQGAVSKFSECFDPTR